MPSVPKIDDPRFVKALSHPMRVRILALLQERTGSPRELAEWIGATLGTVSYHVRALYDLGMLELVGTTQVRGAIAHHYRAREQPQISAAEWDAAPPVAKQAAVSAALLTIGDYAQGSAAAAGFERDGAQLSRSRRRLDQQGWEQAARACERFVGELERIKAAAAQRLEQNPDLQGTCDAVAVAMLFEAPGGAPRK